MKKMNLKLNKETVDVLDRAQMQNAAGGDFCDFITSSDGGGGGGGAETVENGECLFQSRALCITIRPKWDCGGSRSCKALICIPF